MDIESAGVSAHSGEDGKIAEDLPRTEKKCGAQPRTIQKCRAQNSRENAGARTLLARELGGAPDGYSWMLVDLK